MVKISFFEGEFVAISALAAKVSQEPFESGSLKDLYESCLDNIEDCKSFINSVVARGHLIPGDISTNAVGLEYISRFAAIYIWRLVNVYNLIFGAGIEASLRVIEPKEYLEFVSKFAERTFKVYREAIDMGALNQDARYLIPEGVLTRMVFSAPPRYLLKIASSLIGSPLD
jgi:thymidylate synthase ThyX